MVLQLNHFIIEELGQKIRVNLNHKEKIQRSTLLFLYKLKNNLIKVKQLHTN